MTGGAKRGGTLWGKGLVFDRELILINALPYSSILLDEEDRIQGLNPAAEQFFDLSLTQAVGTALQDFLTQDSPLIALVKLCRHKGQRLTEHDVKLETPRLRARRVTLDVTPIVEHPGILLILLREQTIASRIDSHLSSRNAARSLTAMAEMLAHEIKNPLSGIRGAAQLLEPNVAAEDRPLTRLIIDEVDRIKALVDRMEIFADNRVMRREPVNIHEVLDHVRRVAHLGFARNHRFSMYYDPSLPLVHGNRDLLVQLFLNLIKNAAEAMAQPGGEITLKTAYEHIIRLETPASAVGAHLPLKVTVQDNGAGIAEDLLPYLFDAFVTTKSKGSGLGLALAAKIVNDHGGVMIVETHPKRTCFHVYLPMLQDQSDRKKG